MAACDGPLLRAAGCQICDPRRYDARPDRDRVTPPVSGYASAEVPPPVPTALRRHLPWRSLAAHVVVSLAMQMFPTRRGKGVARPALVSLLALHPRGHVSAPGGQAMALLETEMPFDPTFRSVTCSRGVAAR